MVADGVTSDLLFAALLVWLFGFLLLRRHLGLGLALFVAVAKVTFPLFYFAYFNDGSWFQIDDRVYYYWSLRIKSGGYSLFHDLFAPVDHSSVSYLVGSEHRLYYWWNVLAFYVFGDFYYAPVFLNVGLTFLAACMLRSLVYRFEFSKSYANCFMVFFLLQWDVIVWSSFVNLKDTLVLTLTIAALSVLVRLQSRFTLAAGGLLGGIFFLFMMLRQYLPPLLLAAFAISVLTQLEGKKKAALFVLAGGALMLFAPWETEHFDYFEFKFPLWDAIRFLLMPQFWNVEPEREGFIFIPSIFHWLFFLPMIYGGVRLWRDVPRARILFIYFAIMVLFYSVVPELQGTRQRFQLVFLIAWMQFHSVWILLPIAVSREKCSLDITHSNTPALKSEGPVALTG